MYSSESKQTVFQESFQTLTVLQEFFQLSPDLCCIIRPDGSFKQLNRSWEKLLGWNRAELMTQPWMASVHPEDVRTTLKAYQGLATGKAIQFENRHCHKDGSSRWLQWKMSQNPEGWIYGIGRDLTVSETIDRHSEALEPKQTDDGQNAKFPQESSQHLELKLKTLQAEFEARLDAQVQRRTFEFRVLHDIVRKIGYTLSYEELFQSILEELYPAVPYDVSGIIILDTQPHLSSALTDDKPSGEPTCKLFLKTHRPLSTDLQWEIQQQMLGILSYMSAQRQIHPVLRLHHLNTEGIEAGAPLLQELGSSFLVPLVANSNNDNQIIGLLFLGAEQPRQFTEEHIRLLYHVASHASSSVERLRSFLAVELRRLESVVANLPEGVLLLDADGRIVLTNSKARNDLKLLATIEANNVLQKLGGKSLEQLMSCPRGDTNCREVTTATAPDRVFEVAVQPMTVESQLNYWVVAIRDISDRKRVESEIRKALEVEKELSALKSRVVQTVSHEYRTPLTTILAGIDLLKNHNKQLELDRQHHIWELVQKAAKQMAQLVEDMLLLNKTESGKLEFNPVPLDLVAFCQQLLEDLQLFASPRHTLTFTHQGTCPEPYLDATLLRQILTNLLSNAIKYSPEGGIVSLHLNLGEGKARFRIQDQGIGIPQEDRAQIFESFHRGNNVSNIQGTGLGLAIVKKLVELHGADIDWESQVGVGTTFTVQFPC